MAARIKIKSEISVHDISRQEAVQWRRFLSHAPPLDELIEIRRLHDNKTILRRRADLPPSFSPRDAEWRPV